MKKLYIIGNGFDLYHGLPTAYKCFNCFMLKKHPEEHDLIGKIFNPQDPNMLWSDFENMLGQPNLDALCSYLRNSRVSIDDNFDDLFYNINDLFKEWVRSIDMQMFSGKLLNMDPEGEFLNFNYTNTLEKCYEIEDTYICYIHGATMKNEYSKPVVGHGNYSWCKDNEEIINCKSQIYGIPSKIICEFYDWFSKEPDILSRRNENDEYGNPDNYYIFEHESKFNLYKQCHEIYVLGHSLSDVDLPYFKRIANGAPQAHWYVSYMGVEDMKKKQIIIKGIPNINRVEFVTFENL